jgi:hypothetical protein
VSFPSPLPLSWFRKENPLPGVPGHPAAQNCSFTSSIKSSTEPVLRWLSQNTSSGSTCFSVMRGRKEVFETKLPLGHTRFLSQRLSNGPGWNRQGFKIQHGQSYIYIASKRKQCLLVYSLALL